MHMHVNAKLSAKIKPVKSNITAQLEGVLLHLLIGPPLDVRVGIF